MEPKQQQNMIAQSEKTTDASQIAALIFQVRTGLRAGVQDSNPYNDTARASRWAGKSANFLDNFFGG